MKLLAIAIVVVASILPGVAAAQFVVDFDVVPDGPAVCTSTGVSGSSTGTATFTLPNAPNNAYTGISVNGGPVSVLVQSLPGPFPQVQPGLFFSIPLPASTAFPYTVTATAFPALNGVPVGFGSALTVVCDVNGVGVVSVTRGIDAGSRAPLAVPTLPWNGLAALAVLLALAAGWRLRRVVNQRG